MKVEQLLLLRIGDRFEIVAKSHDVSFDREEWVIRTATAYGERPKDHPAFDAVFALPRNHVNVVVVNVVAPPPDAGFTLAFRFLFVHVRVYAQIGDPFEIADQFPVNVHGRGSLPTLELSGSQRPRRMVDDLQALLQDGDAPLLLGSTQALLDGVRVRSASRMNIRGLWQLLPYANQPWLWPCEYALADGLPFHVAVVPIQTDPLPRGTISDEQARDYPPGKFELPLQQAIEAGDQAAVDSLMLRPTGWMVLRMALAMLGFAISMALAFKFMR